MHEQSAAPAPPPTCIRNSEEVCGLCTEKFSDTPSWPVARTVCGHFFHDTCIQQIVHESLSRRRCPICRCHLNREATSIIY
mmetsp:Transcript_2935/g.6154  ORF Transcript_2935/g.6154 Transcript_2935/m.6154 type:complete len:81 (-) Transcript_2935:247-489(-)